MSDQDSPTLELVFGSSAQSEPEVQLREALLPIGLHGHLYFSYPVYESMDDTVRADALLTTREHGVVLFDLSAPPFDPADPDVWIDQICERQDELHRGLKTKLLANRDLVQRRDLGFEINVVTLLSETPPVELPEEAIVRTPETLPALLDGLPALEDRWEVPLNATVQRVTTIKPKRKRTNVVKPDSYGAKLKQIEAKIANLDSWQKMGAIEYPEGPQRIRGLAGSGKTIVLALKAAYLHATHPDWTIAVTYYSRSLRQQFEDLIRRFMFEHKKDEPDWEKLQIMHSWGGRSEAGIYSEIARACDVSPASFGEARSKYGELAFQGVCDELLERIGEIDLQDPLYDAVLIDEAQDLPASFFRVIYAATASPKRIIWAYDELQNLGEYSMTSAEELFGNDAEGRPRVQLRNERNRPQQDIILPICYRNTPWALTVAHGLGFGVNRRATNQGQSSLVQMFDEPDLWTEIGYEAISGQLALGAQVKLRRRPECSPDFFSNPEKRLIEPPDAVSFSCFANVDQQANWIASEVKSDIEERELQIRDILIILPDAWTARTEAGRIIAALGEHSIPAHLVGVTSSREEVFRENSIAIAHIFRAKGNEAPMVYVANAEQCFEGLQLAKKRNTLFTAISRSRAWVRVCGKGPRMEALIHEANRIVDADFALDFVYPTRDEILRMKRIHRDRSASEQEKIEKGIESAAGLMEMIQSGELSLDQLPPELVEMFRELSPGGQGDTEG